MTSSKYTCAISNTDFPAYSDTVYSDTPLSVTLLAIPKPFVKIFKMIRLFLFRILTFSDQRPPSLFWAKFEVKGVCSQI